MTTQAATTQQNMQELVATLFHELRIPISSINGYTSVLLTGELGRINPGQRQTLKRVQELCQSITVLVGNLLALVKSGLQHSYVSREFVDITRLGRDVVHSLQGQIQKKKLKFSARFPSTEIRFWGSPGDINQIFVNLLSNAVKFTPAGSKVSLSVSNRPDVLTIEVSDAGTGIPSSDLPKIFDEFYHVDRPNIEVAPGSGLGLAIIKRIVDGCQGKIQVDSREGHGSSFKITLPIRPEMKILEEFLEEIWVRVRESGEAMGLVLCQLKAGGSRKGSGAQALNRALEEMEQVFREHLRKEDRIFRLPGGSLVGVMVSVKSGGFPIVVQRLERALRNSVAVAKLATKRFRWQMVCTLSPKRGSSPNRFLSSAQMQLKRAWKKTSK